MIVWLKKYDLYLILLFAVLVRIGAALYLGDTVEILPGTHDQVSYDSLAQNVAAGKGFVFDDEWYPFTPANTPTAHWSFLYVLFLAMFYAVVGYHPLVARVFQATAIGLLMPWFVYRLGKRTFGRKIGLAGAAAVSVYVYLVYYSASLMTESFYIVALLWALDTLQRIAEAAREREGKDKRKTLRWFELGLAWGIATLLRQQMLLLVPVFLGWLLWMTWRDVKLRIWLRSAFFSLLVVITLVLPWTIRNAVVYHRFLPLNSNVGWALYAANHPLQGTRFRGDLLPPLPTELAGMNEAEMNSWLTVEGVRFVIEEPGRFVLQTINRFGHYFRFWPEETSSSIANVSRVLSFGLYLPFMLLGLYLSIRPAHSIVSRRDSNPCPRYHRTLLYLFAAIYSAIHLCSWAMHRYRLPVDAVMMVFVGLAFVELFQRLIDQRMISLDAEVP